MYKVMIFIDGTWLYRTLPRLAEQSGKGEFKIDYGVLPRVVARELGERLGVGREGVDVVRNHIFASLPTNYDSMDESLITRQNEFYKLLREGLPLRNRAVQHRFPGPAGCVTATAARRTTSIPGKSAWT